MFDAKGVVGVNYHVVIFCFQECRYCCLWKNVLLNIEVLFRERNECYLLYLRRLFAPVKFFNLAINKCIFIAIKNYANEP